MVYDHQSSINLFIKTRQETKTQLYSLL